MPKKKASGPHSLHDSDRYEKEAMRGLKKTEA